MPDRPRGTIAQSVNSLAELRLSEQTLDALLSHIGNVGVKTLEGWHAAAATLIEDDKVATFGSTDERVNPVDQAQYDLGKGPCVDCVMLDEVQYFDGHTDAPRWRQFGEALADEGFYSVVSFPLKLDDEVMGALNFYSHERDALREGQREEGHVFAAQAAVAIANTNALLDRGAQIEQLEDGLETRTLIGQATGILMAQEGLSSSGAFDKLVQISQTSNVKLREIAKRYVAAWEEKVE